MRPPGDFGELVRTAVRRQGEAFLPVTGTSMLPTLAPGRTVRVVSVPYGAVRVGDVVAVRIGSGVLVHRVVHREADRLVTRGDAMPLLDPATGEEEFLGVVPDLPPAPPRPVSPVAPTGPDRVHLWLFGGGTVDVPADWTVHWLSRTGAGIGSAALVAVAAAVRTGLRIGVSPYGPDPLGALRPPGGTVHLLVGCAFGGTLPGGARLLPPALADVHVRVGAPAEPVGVPAAVAALVRALAPVGATP